MNKLTHRIKQHQIVAFFAVTFAITWGLGFFFDEAMNKDNFCCGSWLL